MNRTIKFRAWDDDNKIMFQNAHTIKVIDDSFYEANDVWDLEYELTENLMQYTGITDKNGVDIYEGDIVTFPWISPMGEPESKHSYYGKIIFYDGSFMMEPIKSDAGYWGKQLIARLIKPEVIGNVYQNKDLLNDS